MRRPFPQPMSMKPGNGGKFVELLLLLLLLVSCVLLLVGCSSVCCCCCCSGGGGGGGAAYMSLQSSMRKAAMAISSKTCFPGSVTSTQFSLRYLPYVVFKRVYVSW